MRFKLTYQILSLLFCLSTFPQAKGQWSGVYGNEWINHDNKYLRLSVSEPGLYKVALSSLPADFSKDHTLLQLWHKGKEVSIIQSDSKEFWFYAETNDGSSDSLLFRPASSRMNPYQSFFSDKGIYFLTKKVNPKRATVIEKSTLSGVPEPYSLYTEVKSLRSQFSFSTLTASPLVPNNSYYENINTWTGPVIYGDSAVGSNTTNRVSNHQFSLVNYKASQGKLPELSLMVNGLHHGRHNVKVSVGKTDGDSDQKELSLISFTGIGGVKRERLILSEEQFSADKGGVISLRSNSADIYDWFSLTYYTLTYPQEVKMEGGKSKYFNFPATTSATSRIKIETTDSQSVILNVSDPFDPKLIRGSYDAGALEVMVARTANQNLRLFSVGLDQIKSIEPAAVSMVDFLPLSSYPAFSKDTYKILPQSYDYLIITSDTLKAAAIEYAKYRSSDAGGNYRTIVYDAKTIYNQFNYGEPSAVGVKRFVEYMLKQGIRDNHNLLLVGISVTAPDAAELRLKKDLPNEVPTIGDPGADILLVSGLHGGGQDKPAIPVGRISAFNQQQVLNYLAKVKEFEADKSDKLWQKNVLHLSGGKTSAEISQLSIILKDLSPLVEKGTFAGSVKAFVKQSTVETERVDVSSEVNAGVGMISYFGHGSPTITDLDMGKVSDVTRKFNNPSKYPLMYFNGCGVGNVYAGRSTVTLSTDWVVSPNMGAIACIANSYNSYVSPTSKHLKLLYEELFTGGELNQTIGQALRNVALRVLSSNPDSYDITNIHQSNLQGDPAIRLFNFNHPDYSLDVAKPIILLSDEPAKAIGNSSYINIGSIIMNAGKYVGGQSVPIKVTYTYEDGRSESLVDKFASFSSVDTVFFRIPYNRMLRRINVVIDPENTISEISKDNNSAELNVDWNIANALAVYPEDVLIDLIPPVVSFSFNSNSISNKSIIPSNSILSVFLEDNESVPLESSLLELYIKNCWDNNCEYQKVDLESYEVVRHGRNAIEISNHLTNLNPGQYELLVNGKDKVGNSLSSGYKIQFEIEADVPLVATVSPNPATDYVKFELDVNNPDEIESVVYLIYNKSGNIVKKSENRSHHAGKNIWYWLPQNAAAGVYLYQLEILKKDKTRSKIKGKLIIL